MIRPFEFLLNSFDYDLVVFEGELLEEVVDPPSENIFVLVLEAVEKQSS